MSDVTITVRGEHEVRVSPERATIRITVRAEGAERETVVDRVLRLAEPVRAGLGERADAGAALEWASTRLALRTERPWNSEGRRLAPIHYASVDFTATFADAAELSAWVSDIVSEDGVEVGSVDWSLTTETHARVEREVASQAVAVAVARAGAYASALGLDEVIPVEIADVGLISEPHQPFAPGMLKASAFAAAESGPAMQYEPEDITVAAIVEARFFAR